MKLGRGLPVWLALWLLGTVLPAHGQCFTEFRASLDSFPDGITAGPDGNVWFSEFDTGSIGRILPLAPHTITEFNVSTADIRPSGITAGPDGNLWFVEITGNRVGRITPMSPNTITRFPLPTANATPQQIVAGPDGNLWFTEGIGKIGRITPGAPNTITEFPVPSGQGAGDIAVGPDGNLWFTETYVGGNEGGDKIGRITPGAPNIITEFTVPRANCAPRGITAGPDGNLWFTEVLGNQIGRISPEAPNMITEFQVPTPNARPFSIVAGPDGNLWFGEGGSLGKISPADPTTIKEFTVGIDDLANGPDGNLWFTAANESVWRLGIGDCDQCVAAKLKAIAKLEAGSFDCAAKAATIGDSSGVADCIARLETKYTSAFAKGGECGSSDALCRSRADACVSQVLTNLADLNRCEAAKLKAARAALTTVFGCTIRSASRGKPVDPTCELILPGSKVQPKLDAAFARADVSGPCAGDSFTLGAVLELACHIQLPITDAAGTVAGFMCPRT